MTTTDRYDQRENTGYAICNDCDVVLLDEQEKRTHMTETLKASKTKRSHFVRTINPSRAERIDNAIDGLVEEAMYDVCSRIEDLIADNHITENEALAVIRKTVIDLGDEWDHYND